MDVEDGADEGNEGRTVTLVVVGVRSVPSNGSLGNPQNGGGIGLDALLGLPHLPPINGNTSQEGGNLGNTASRPPTSRFNNGGVGSTDNLNSGHTRPASGILRSPLEPTSPALPTVLADSPPGPYPPPSTPAEVPITLSSGNSTPSRRSSSASAMSPNLLPQVHEDPLQESTQSESYPPTAGSGIRQRRRSDSEFARHRHLGSGSSRRHGVVEPDQPTPSGGRTWVIYVVGTNLSENHPAFATPSLFTDVSLHYLLPEILM